MCQLPNSKLVKDAISSLHPSAKIQIGLTNDDGAAGFKEVTDLVNYVVAQKKWRVTTAMGCSSVQNYVRVVGDFENVWTEGSRRGNRTSGYWRI